MDERENSFIKLPAEGTSLWGPTSSSNQINSSIPLGWDEKGESKSQKKKEHQEEETFFLEGYYFWRHDIVMMMMMIIIMMLLPFGGVVWVSQK
jgi:hypothetical protein